MATYKGIQGYTVQKLSSDPTASEAAGQLWYNSSTGKFKIGTEGAAAWASGTNTSRSGTTDAQLSGTQTAALYAGGYAPAPTLNRAETEKYDGTTWTEVADLNTARYGAKGSGLQAAALCFAGTTGGSDRKTLNESWNGTSWTEIGDLNTARTDPGGFGATSTAAVCAGGNTSPGANFTVNVET